MIEVSEFNYLTFPHDAVSIFPSVFLSSFLSFFLSIFLSFFSFFLPSFFLSQNVLNN